MSNLTKLSNTLANLINCLFFVNQSHHTMPMHTIKYFSVYLLFLLLYSCNIKSIVDIEGIDPLDISCFITENSEFVINDPENYQLLFADSTCSSYNPPPIDFNERTLLGQRTEATGCFAFYTRSVRADTDAKRYIYEVSVKVGSAGCDTAKQLVNYNWVTVPKLPDKYEVIFAVSYK